MGSVQSNNNKNNKTEPIKDKNGYHVVKVQTLKPVENSITDKNNDMSKYWLKTKCKHYDDGCNCSILCYRENNKGNCHHQRNNFYGAFVNAYNNHGDIILSPDDIWIMICLKFSKYINDNSEALREKFVSHTGKKALSVTTSNQLKESEWDEFFNLVLESIRDNTKEGIVDKMVSDFSTTQQFEKFISTISIMDSFKQYFDYIRCIPCCGIANLKFMGTLHDWEYLHDKILLLKEYDVDNTWTDYIQNLIPIMNQFIESYKGNVDVDFWNKIMNFEYGRGGSGSVDYVSGWILNFFGLKGKIDDDDIPNYNFDVPVTILNYLTNTKKVVNIIGGFSGIYNDNNSYRPQLSYAVYHDGNTESL